MHLPFQLFHLLFIKNPIRNGRSGMVAVKKPFLRRNG